LAGLAIGIATLVLLLLAGASSPLPTMGVGGATVRFGATVLAGVALTAGAESAALTAGGAEGATVSASGTDGSVATAVAVGTAAGGSAVAWTMGCADGAGSTVDTARACRITAIPMPAGTAIAQPMNTARVSIRLAAFESRGRGARCTERDGSGALKTVGAAGSAGLLASAAAIARPFGVRRASGTPGLTEGLLRCAAGGAECLSSL